MNAEIEALIAKSKQRSEAYQNFKKVREFAAWEREQKTRKVFEKQEAKYAYLYKQGLATEEALNELFEWGNQQRASAWAEYREKIAAAQKAYEDLL